MAYGRLAIKD